MAEKKRVTTEEVVGYLLEGDGLDFLRESLSWVVQQLRRIESRRSEFRAADSGTSVSKSRQVATPKS
jgi:hypothetical protein